MDEISGRREPGAWEGVPQGYRAPVFGAEDGSTRHVSDWLVDLIVDLFVRRHAAPAA